MKWLLDTNICVAWLNGSDEVLRRRLQSMQVSELRLCSVVKAELLFGARKSSRVSENLERLAALFEAVESVSFDDLAAQEYGMLRAQLEKSGTPIGANDLMIASIALAADFTLATRNVGEFQRVPALKIERW